MAFTRQQVLEMQQKLASLGYKDTDFEILSTENIGGEEWVAVVDNGVNRRMLLADFESYIITKNIPDLDEIRQNAAQGATAYHMPNGGIPRSHLSSNVQRSLGKADSAVQPSTLQNALKDKQDKLTFDDYPTPGSDNPVKSGGIAQAIDEIDKLESISVNGTPVAKDANNNVDITVPTQLSQLTEDTDHRLVSDAEKDLWDNKYDFPDGGIPASDLAPGVIPDLSKYITKWVNDLVYYYKKSEVYNKQEINSLVSGFQQYAPVVVEELPDATADTMYHLYLAPSQDPQTGNVYDEFITVDLGESANPRYKWELVGSTAIDLSGYVTTEALSTALANYTTTTDLTTLLAAKQDVIDAQHKLDYSLLDNAPDVPKSLSVNLAPIAGEYVVIGETKAEAAAALGITTEHLDALMAGEFDQLIFRYDWQIGYRTLQILGIGIVYLCIYDDGTRVGAIAFSIGGGGYGYEYRPLGYVKPAEGIPATDLASGVQTAVDNATITGKIFRGTCSTASGTAAKVVTCPDFNSSDLVKGAAILVTFTATNTADVADLTMDVNSTGAKGLKKIYNAITRSNLTAAGELRIDQTYLFVYDGTAWVCLTLNYNSSYSVMSQSEADTGTATTGRIISAKVLADTITNRISGKQDALVGSGTGQNIKTVNDQSLLGTGNIDAKDIFWATYDSTTSAQIEAAYQAGKMVCVFWNNRVYTLIYRSSATGHTFGYVWGGTTYRVVCTSNAWTNTSVALQNTEDKVSTLTGYESNTSKYPNTKAVYDAIAALPSPMVFKGTIGTGGTSTTVPSSPTEGDTYKIISGGESLTFSGISGTIKVGDTVIYKNSTTGWVLIPSGDEPSGTVTNVTAGAGLNTTGDDASSDGGSITSSGSINLTKSGVAAGTYQGLTVDKYGRVTAASDEGYYKKPNTGIPASDLANGVIAEEIFWATYGTTTATEIETALAAGKAIICKHNNVQAIYVEKIGTAYYFYGIAGGTLYRRVLNNGTWQSTSATIQDAGSRISAWHTTPSDVYYPSEKLVKDSLDGKQDTLVSGTNIKTVNSTSLLGNGDIDANNVLWCTVNTTTATEIANAITAGKYCLVWSGDTLYALYKETNTQYFFGACDGTYHHEYGVWKDSSVWQYGSHRYELQENRVSSWQSTPDNNHYPSEKLVKDSIDANAVEANPTVPSGTTPTSLTGLKVGSDYYSVSGGGGGGTTVEANPTVPSGTTPTDVKGLKIGNDYYDICAVHLDITNNDIDSAINTAWV